MSVNSATTSTSQPVLLDVSHLSFSYNGSRVLEDVTLQVKKGEYLGIIGPNGSGKTTLLRLILGLLPDGSNSISLFGQPQHHFQHWSKIGYVPQKATQFEANFPITVKEVVALGAIGLKKSLSVHHALKLVGMESFEKRLLSELSGGQQQRVFIAKALISQPELLILDEPTVGVDVESQDTFYELLSQLNKEQGLTIVLVSHDIDVIANEVDSIACINKQLIYHGTPKRFIKEDYLEKLYGKGRQFIIHGH
jgi:zinc transport system ATP-binding protein